MKQRIANKKPANPHNSIFIEQHEISLSNYRKKVKIKKTSFRNQSFKDIEEALGDSSDFWKNIKNSAKAAYQNLLLMKIFLPQNGKTILKISLRKKENNPYLILSKNNPQRL